MAPHHRKYPPASGQGQVSSSDSSLVLAKPIEVNGAQQSTGNDGKATPRDLIQEETVSTLIGEARCLRQRCKFLEEANAELKREMRAMEPAKSRLSIPNTPGHGQLQLLTNSNLSGYASSTSSVSSETPVLDKDTTHDQQDLEDFKDFVNTKIDAMTQILESFETALKTEGVSRYKLAEDLERAKHDATRTKGRLGTAETSIKEIRHDFDELAVSTTETHSNTNATTHLDKQDGEQVKRMQAQLTSALAELKSLSQLVHDQADAIDDLSVQLDGGPAQKASDGREMTAADFANRINATKKANTQPSADFSLLQKNVDRMMRKARMQRAIDEMYKKDELQNAFRKLTTVLKVADSSSDQILHIGQFEGTYAELWSLRDRVTRRIAGIKQYGQAFAETWSAIHS